MRQNNNPTDLKRRIKLKKLQRSFKKKTQVEFKSVQFISTAQTQNGQMILKALDDAFGFNSCPQICNRQRRQTVRQIQSEVDNLQSFQSLLTVLSEETQQFVFLDFGVIPLTD